MIPPSQEKRPLSPHLQVYKIQITSLLSVLHRGTGMVLYGGAVLCALWFIAVARGPESYERMQSFLFHPLGLVILLGVSFSFFYHLCNGVRHLCWDIGIGYDLSTVRRTGWAVIVSSFFLTGAAWMLGILGEKMGS
jgi:succinate dehydrogenase / fumarate reductase cytochrome b subunit